MFLIIYVIRCAACKVEETILTLPATDEGREYIPHRPIGWKEGHNGTFYCPRHTVTFKQVIKYHVTVDGKPIL